MENVIAAVGIWNRDLYEHYSSRLPGQWFFVENPAELDELLKSGISPRYIFFPHWRWVVPKALTDRYECVCFHMTDVPYGRGGSPLQNLIVRGHKDTRLTALQMDEGMDTGPVYFKRPLNLCGSANEIYIRAAELSWSMIEEIIETQPKPIPQRGEVIEFTRRTPAQNYIPDGLKIAQVFDYIRMLDAPGYPRAFLEAGDYHIEFENAVLEDGFLNACVKVRLRNSE